MNIIPVSKTCVSNATRASHYAEVAVTFYHTSDGNSMAELLNQRAAAELCPDVCGNTTRPYVGNCGGLANDAPGKWCPAQAAASAGGPYLDAPICCAASEKECCVIDEGALSGVIIGKGGGRGHDLA